MNVHFISAHLQTLCDLKALADKHNCIINFGVDNYEGTEDIDFNYFDGSTKKIIKELNHKGKFENPKYNITHLWFELHDKNNNSYHALSYSEGEQSATYILNYLEELSDEASAFLEDNLVSWQSIEDDELLITCRLDKTTMTGFPGQEKPEVYREGMTLKFFADLVCDYLGEKRIERVY